MSRIEHLSSFFIERLMSVAAEIYEAVKDTVSDYQREIERTKEENHRLRELLAEISLSASGEPKDPATDLQPSRPELSPEKLPNSYRRPPDSDPSVLQQKLELTSVKEETETQQLPPNSVSTSTSPRGKSGHDEEFTCLSGTLRMAEETDQQMDHIKLEQYDTQVACPSTVLNSIAEPAAGPSRDLMGSVMVTQGSNVVCEDPFIDSSSLASHLQYHENSSHDCKVCGQSFTKCACLFQHRKVVHDKGKLYCCKLCGKCYRQPHSLTVHFRNHTGEKPFRCKFCGKTFIDRGHCNEHERIHTGDKRYTCTVCGKSFVQSSQLRTHLRSKH